MEEFREKIQYKDGSIEICMNTLTSIEHYEMIRLIFAFRGKSVCVCKHGRANTYVEDILAELNVREYTCST